MTTFKEKLFSRVKLIAFLVLGGCVMTLMTCRSCLGDFNRYMLVASFCVSIWIAMWIGNEYIVTFIDKKISWTKEPIKRLLAGLVGMIAYTVFGGYVIMLAFDLVGFSFGSVAGIIYGSIITTTIITVVLTSRSFLLNWRKAAI